MPKPVSRQFLSGIVEGFYGREWPWPERRRYAEFLASQGFNTYLYCPKGDQWLRRQWSRPWPAGQRAELEGLAALCRERGLNWGVGLSPYALYENYGGAERKRLQGKIGEIDALGGNLLAVLFDDMPGGCPDLANRQAEILGDIEAWSGADVLLTCPTYYSFDPALERLFGQRPEGYWQRFGEQVSSRYGIFWCGNKVCPDTISREDIAPIAGELARPPVLWDNYPVNDGERASRFLHLEPLSGREPELHGSLAGHLCNPMNQPRLSMYPLGGLTALLGGKAGSLTDVYGEPLGSLLAEDRELFETEGLDGMGKETKQRLVARYRDIDHPAATEVVDWLTEQYRFDPACLTG